MLPCSCVSSGVNEPLNEQLFGIKVAREFQMALGGHQVMG